MDDNIQAILKSMDEPRGIPLSVRQAKEAAAAVVVETNAVLARAAGLLKRAEEDLSAFDKADAEARTCAVEDLKVAIKAGVEHAISVDERRFVSRSKLEACVAIHRRAHEELRMECAAAQRKAFAASEQYDQFSGQRAERLRLEALRK